MDSDHETPPSARSDLISGAVWVVIGVAIGIASWRMDRLASQGVPGFAAPGLLPGILGVMITATGLAIVLRSLRRGALAPAPLDGAAPLFSGRAALALVLCLGFAGGLVGHGLSFPVAAALYLFAHIFLLQLPERRAAGTVLRGTLVAATIAVVAAGVISFLFQYVFLVRLP